MTRWVKCQHGLAWPWSKTSFVLTPHLPELADQFEDHLTSHTFHSSFLDRYDFNNIRMIV
jgi:hypothetical protein